MADPVNHPPHYNGHPSGVECIQIVEHMNFCRGNAVKYIWRAGEKDPAAEIEDLKKARWYLDREIARLEGASRMNADLFSGLPVEEDRGATLSDDGVYRYLLWRRWDKTKPRACFIMLNPSTADASVDDPTIRRCIGFAKAWGMGGIRVANLFAFRATEPKHLLSAADPIGPGNLGYIEKAIDTRGIAIAAWGAHKMVETQARRVRVMFYELGVPLYALRLTADGHPGHPLYVPASVVPVVYEQARGRLVAGEPWPGKEAA